MNDLDQSNVIADAQGAWDDEYATLDIPYVPIDTIIVVVGEKLRIPPSEFMNAYSDDVEGIDLPMLKSVYGVDGVNLMCALMDEAINSSTETPWVRRGVEMLQAYPS